MRQSQLSRVRSRSEKHLMLLAEVTCGFQRPEQLDGNVDSCVGPRGLQLWRVLNDLFMQAVKVLILTGVEFGLPEF